MAHLQLPCHPHPLKLRELSELCNSLKCLACDDEIHGSMYCCEECMFLLHKSCAELSPLERHPLHSQHPLTLQTHDQQHYCDACLGVTSFTFSCDICHFDVHGACAIATMLDTDPAAKEVEDNVDFPHFSHEHPLTSFQVKRKSDIGCRGCKRPLSGEVYGCFKCIFFLHKTCAESPREIQNYPFHKHHIFTLIFDDSGKFSCEVCAFGGHLVYRCDECEFNLDVHCLNSTLPCESDRQESRSSIDNFGHPHQLIPFYSANETWMICNCCRKRISGEFHGCPDCSFYLHESCEQSPREIQHFLHPIHPLTHGEWPQHKILRCGSCCTIVTGGFGYYCKTCEFYLHKECALQTLAYLEEGLSATTHILSIDAEMVLCHMQGDTNCSGCGEDYGGPWYRSLQMYLVLHKSCAELASETRHSFRPEHRLALVRGNELVYNRCSVCREATNRLIFSCLECPFALDFKCASQKPTIEDGLHKHSLSYFEKMTGLDCNACGKRCGFDLYRCVQCNYNVHHDCNHQLPRSIKHKRHGCPLILYESVVEDDYSVMYFCEICTRRRNEKHWAYSCKECVFIADVVCANSPEELPAAEENPAIARLDARIALVQGNVNVTKANLEALVTQLEELVRERTALAKKY